MRNRFRKSSAALFVLVTLFLAGTVSAQSFEVVRAFVEPPKRPMGRLLEVAEGLFYGVSTDGGAFSGGAVFVLFRRPHHTWSTVTIHSFNGTDGLNPWGGLIRGRDGNFYGTTLLGGAHDKGTIFRMTWFGALTTLHSFSGPEGASPRAPLVQARNGEFYGTTTDGGLDQAGTVFKITGEGHFTLLHLFGNTDGRFPSGLIQAADGDFYGTTWTGGPDTVGTAYRVTDAGVVTVLHYFQYGGEEGRNPLAGLVQGSDGDFYGTASQSASSAGNAGTVFKMTLNGNVTLLHTFAFAPGGEGAVPETGLVEAPDHNFFGTTTTGAADGPAVFGTAYRIDSAKNFATIATFGGALGITPSELTLTRSGLLVGTTQRGGVPTPTGLTGGFGTAFSMTTNGPATLLYAFSGMSPRWPTGRLVEGAAGELYGTSCRGGVFDLGTVFKLIGSRVSTLYSFSGSRGQSAASTDGSCPVSGLVRAPDGSFYGTTELGGLTDRDGREGGTVFKITPAGELTILHAPLIGEGARPRGPLALGLDGSLYGTTAAPATVFRMTTAGAVTTLHQFTYEGSAPLAGPMLASDGNFYGTTAFSGTPGLFGSLYRVTPGGEFTNLHFFTAEGARPFSAPIEARDGSLYGTAATGGALGAGIVFKSTLSGTVSILHEFTFNDGSAPAGQLLEGSDGNFYGTTYGRSGAGSGQCGTVFKMEPDGTLTTLHAFSCLDGANPFAGLTQSSGGALYGTTVRGGPGQGGVIFRIVPE